MKIKANPNYEAGFVRATDHDEMGPEELQRRAARKARLNMFAIGTAVVVVIGSAIGVTLQLRRDTPAKQVERGIAFSATNSHVAAVIEFKRALQDEPEQPAVRVLLGQELSLLGDAKGAEIEYRKAADAKYLPEKTLPLLATALLHQAKFEQVISFVNAAQTDSAQANAELLSLRGASYFALGRETEAYDSWKAANDFVPGNPATVLAEARAFAAKGKFDDADKVLKTIGPGAPKVELFTLQGDINRAIGKPLEAVADYEAAIKIEPGNMFVRENLAQALVQLKRFDEALDQVKRIIAPMPNNANAHFIGALVGIGKDDYAMADEYIGRAVQITPTDGRYQLMAGMVALHQGRRDDAQQHLRDAVTLMPLNASARRLLAMIYVDKRDANKADDLFRPVFESFKTDPDIARIAARIASLKGDSARAASAFDQVDASDPKNIDATLLGASLKIASGDKAGGFARLHAASAADPGNPDVDSAIVKAYLTIGDQKEALAAWNVLAQKLPSDARTLNLHAAIDIARGDKATARRYMQQSAAADPRYLAPVSGLALLDIGVKKVDEAKSQLRDFIKANPTDVEATQLLIQVEKANGNDSKVVLGLLTDSLKANPRSAPITYALVDFYASHGDPKKALAIAEGGLAFAPENLSLLLFVGNQALASGNSERAIPIFTKLMDLDASSADYPTRLGLAQLAAGNGEETLTAFRLALARQPDNLDRQIALVGSLLSASKADEAARMLFEITRLAPKSPLIPELDADVKLGLRQYPEANSAYRKALALKPSPRLVVKTYNGLMTARQRGEANSFLVDWLKAHPNDEQVRRFDGEVAMRATDYPRAVADFRLLAAAHPNDPMILNNLAFNLSRMNDPQAIAIAEKARALAPDNAAIGDTLGWILIEKGDTGRGLELIEKASLAAPDQLEIRLHLAQAQMKQGRNDAARATLQSLVATAPSSEEAKASRELLAKL